ncbi:uncharacterized protein LOC131327817 [Rhododendron vialii]|uniref:uncharacterized protein LOC131327817 n=1 Tax=Rhododendron vialii TaxID=182163 RepID=UPI00265EBC7F|nr:uncharacterized protein LOC131327817 [Rhododendron vialii]
MIKFSSWNVKGLNNPTKQGEVRKFIHFNRLSLMGIVESKIRQENMVGAMKKCLPDGWAFVHNIGGPKVSVLASSDQMMLLSVQVENRFFALYVVYGFNQVGPRRQLWDDLRSGFASIGDQPWIVMGDFNVVRWQNEKSNSSYFDANATGEFNSCIEDIEMEELTSKGLWFTWSNKQVGVGHYSCRLDRALVNSSWQSEFTESEVAALAPAISDHCPLLVTSWDRPVDKVGSPMFFLYEKLRILKPCLKNFNKEFYSDIQNRKSRVRWLQLGDSNTRFFHKKIASHRTRNKILSICDENGQRLDNIKDVKGEILRFYQKLLGAKFDQKRPSEERLCFANTVPVSFHEGLTSPITPDEIKRALFSIDGDKSPGPDGFNASFFQKNWAVVGKEVIDAVLSFFHSGSLLRDVNATALVLIPKTSCPQSMKEYHPIACCNVIYKTITKLLAQRLQPVLPFVINKAQAAFVKGRSISDNILLMQELVRNYQRDSGVPRCAIKIDLMKAYDLVDWEFLFEVMAAMEFPSLFISWIGSCITSAMFSVVVNGELEGSPSYSSYPRRVITSQIFEGASHFNKAEKIIKEVEAMLRSFLWSGLNLTNVDAKVSWLAVCTPKAEGGLGLKSLQIWNKVSMMRHLWALCKKEDNLWVKWIHSYFIKDQNFWVMKLPQDCSWTMRKLMKLRRLCQLWVKHVIGNEHNREYEIIWAISPTGLYNSKHTWEALRNRGEKVQWASLVWFPRSVSKWSFILWLACLRRLSTKERLCQWGMTIDSVCVLCSQRDETLQHLFFACSFSRNIWMVIPHRFLVQRDPNEWDSELMWAIDHCRGESLKVFLLKLVLAAGVYYIWLERNSRVFGGIHRGAAQVLASIEDNVRLRVCTWEHFPNSIENQRLCCSWNISRGILGA